MPPPTVATPEQTYTLQEKLNVISKDDYLVLQILEILQEINSPQSDANNLFFDKIGNSDSISAKIGILAIRINANCEKIKSTVPPV